MIKLLEGSERLLQIDLAELDIYLSIDLLRLGL